MHPIVKTEAKTIESAKEALSDETISSISLAGGQISTQFYSLSDETISSISLAVAEPGGAIFL